MLRVILFSAAYLVYSKGSRGITDVCTLHIHRSQLPPTRTSHILYAPAFHACVSSLLRASRMLTSQAPQKHAMPNKWSDQHANPLLSSTSRRLHVPQSTKGSIFISW